MDDWHKARKRVDDLSCQCYEYGKEWAFEDMVADLVVAARYAAGILDDEGCPHSAESLRRALRPFEQD